MNQHPQLVQVRTESSMDELFTAATPTTARTRMKATIAM
jgi:hypothetical protein